MTAPRQPVTRSLGTASSTPHVQDDATTSAAVQDCTVPPIIQIGRCQCGCGQLAAVPTYHNPKYGYVKGQPARFARGHNRRNGTGTQAFSQRRPGTHGANAIQSKVHILIAETALSHALPKGAHVHHVDENPRNNANRNLVICQDARYHKLLHVRMRILRAGGNPNTQRICIYCQRPTDFADLVGGFDPMWIRHGWKCRTCHAAKELARIHAKAAGA